jgi:hypothetical protein
MIISLGLTHHCYCNTHFVQKDKKQQFLRNVTQLLLVKHVTPGDLYDAVLEPTEWEDHMQRLAGFCPPKKPDYKSFQKYCGGILRQERPEPPQPPGTAKARRGGSTGAAPLPLPLPVPLCQQQPTPLLAPSSVPTSGGAGSSSGVTRPAQVACLVGSPSSFRPLKRHQPGGNPTPEPPAALAQDLLSRLNEGSIDWGSFGQLGVHDLDQCTQFLVGQGGGAQIDQGGGAQNP